MGQDFLSRVTKTSLISGLILAAVAVVGWTPSSGAGWFLGVLWSVINLYFIGVIVRILMAKRPGGKLRAALIVVVKIPLLYTIGFLLLASGRFNVVALLAGFTWPFIVVTLKILGRAILKMDRPGRIVEQDADMASQRVQTLGKPNNA